MGKHTISLVTDSQYGSQRTEQRADLSLAVLVSPSAHQSCLNGLLISQITLLVLDYSSIRKSTVLTPNYA
jgi:hypothetical protein